MASLAEHPLFTTVLSGRVRRGVRAKGYHGTSLDDGMALVTPDLVESVATAIGVTIPDVPSSSSTGTDEKARADAPGSGFFAQLLAAISSFLATPGGQALEKAIIDAIIAALTGA